MVQLAIHESLPYVQLDPSLPTLQVQPSFAVVLSSTHSWQALDHALDWKGYYHFSMADRRSDWEDDPHKRDPMFFDAELTEVLSDEALHEFS